MENLKIKSVYEFDKSEIEYLNEKYQVTKAVAVCFLGKTKFTLDEKGNVRISGEAAYGAFDKEQWKNIKRIVNGKKHIVGLKNDGMVVAYGDNSNGQCNVQDWKNVIVVDIDGDKTIGFTKSGMLETQKEEVIQGKCGANASYKLIGNTLYIDGTGRVTGENRTSRFRSLPNEIENVIISDGITGIGEYAFRDCTSLKSITIPNSVKKIGDNAFYGCKALEVITIPRSVTYIGKSAFDYCDNLTINGEAGSYAQRYKKDFEAGTSKNSDNSKEIVKKPKKKGFIFAVVAVVLVVVSSIVIVNYFHTHGKCGENASYKLTGNTLYIDGTGKVTGQNHTSRFKSLSNEIENVIIADGITRIGGDTFSSCKSLKSITIPSSVTEIGAGAFNDCMSLESITIPSSVTYIGMYAFGGCTSLKGITIPDSVTKIGAYTFKNCTSLKSITVPSSVTEIGEGAFRGCTSLESVTIPRRVINIGEGAFWGCGSLTIHGEAGSYAERYAKENDINFGSI